MRLNYFICTRNERVVRREHVDAYLTLRRYVNFNYSMENKDEANHD
ncbi:MAG: hypothetical protein RI993_520 [Pseudomonadota bacterium]|jgi:hypothetical protein